MAGKVAGCKYFLPVQERKLAKRMDRGNREAPPRYQGSRFASRQYLGIHISDENLNNVSNEVAKSQYSEAAAPN
jgi:hypothetical protein